MKKQFEEALSKIKSCWNNPSAESVQKIQTTFESLTQDSGIQDYLRNETQKFPAGMEIYRDKDKGFILLSYAETQGQYRNPHNHGEAWVIYAVISGEVQMGSYFRFNMPNLNYKLIQKNAEILSTGQTRTYYPGEIHDTRCLSKEAVILRLTSSDLKIEEQMGRMHRYLV